MDNYVDTFEKKKKDINESINLLLEKGTEDEETLIIMKELIKVIKIKK